MKVALAFSTKNRIEYTKQTLPRVLDEAEGNFDLFWLDGSDTAEGRQFPADFAYNWRREHDGKYPLKETHYNVGGGPDAVINAAWKYLYDKGTYDYIGLIENDVMLTPGWFRRCMDLFEKDPGHGVKVGAVSARCFTDRILDKYTDFATMANVGAGMIIIRREMIPALLMNYRKPALWEMEVFFRHFLGRSYPLPNLVKEKGTEPGQEWVMSCDWFWEAVLLRHGYATLACVPSMAFCLDDPDGKRDRVET